MATPVPAPQGLTEEDLFNIVESERARRATGKLPGSVAVREPPFPGGFEAERQALEEESLKKFIETTDVDIFTPVGAAEAEKEQERIREVTAAPRTPTGEREPIVDVAVDPITNLAKGAVSFLGLEPVVEALKPQEILSPAEYAQAERQFQQDIDRYYNDYLNKIDAQELPLPEGFNTYDEWSERARSQQGYNVFKDEFLKAGGPRGETLVRPVEEAGPAIVQKGVMALGELGTVEERDERGKLAVREGIVATALRDLMLPETFVTAVGQEAIEVFDDRIVEEKPFVRRWAENQRRAQGVEELSADTAETILNAAGIPEEDRQGLVDLAWWGGMGASLAMPLDAGLFTAAKGGTKLASKATKTAIKFPDVYKSMRASAEGANPFLKATALKDLADELALHPLDLRVRLGESLGGIDTYRDAANELIDTVPLIRKQEDAFKETPTLKKVFQGTPTYNIMASADFATDVPRIVQGAARRARIRHGATDSVGDALLSIENLDPDVIMRGNTKAAFAGDSDSFRIAEELLVDEIAQTIAGRAAKERMFTGQQAFPDDYTLITSRLAVPKETVNALLRRTRNNDFTTRIDKARETDDFLEIVDDMRAAGAPSAVLNRARELIIDEQPYTVIRRYLQDANIEMVAKQIAPASVFDMAEILDISEAARRGVPTELYESRGVGRIVEGQEDVITGEFYTKTLENIDDLLTPEALRRSKVGKLLIKALDFREPPRNPVYDSLNKKLASRISNLDDEIVDKVTRAHNKGEPYILAVGRYINEDLELSPREFGAKYLKASLGITDDVGTAFSSAGGTRGIALMSGQVPKSRIFDHLTAPFQTNDLATNLDFLGGFTEFSEAYWATLAQVADELKGKRLIELDGVQEALDEADLNYLKERNVRFTLDPDKQDENIAGLVILRAREKAIDDFGRDVMNTMPEIFANKDRIKRVFDQGADVLEAAGGFQVSQRMLRQLGPFLDGAPPEVIQAIAKTAEEFANSLPKEDFVLAAVADRVVATMGIPPQAVRRLVRKNLALPSSTADVALRADSAGQLGLLPSFDIRKALQKNLPLGSAGYDSPVIIRAVTEVIAATLQSDRVSNELFSLMMLDDFAGPRGLESMVNELVAIREAMGATDVFSLLDPTLDAVLDVSTKSPFDALSPIEAAQRIPVNIRTGTKELGRNVIKEVQTNMANVIRLQRIEDAEDLISQLARASEDLPGSVLQRVARLVGNVPGWASSSWDVAQSISKNSVLGGAFVPNIPHLVMNALSAPAIMLSTIGFGKSFGVLVSPLSAVQSVQTLRYLYANRTSSFGLGYLGKPDGNKTVFIDKAGRGWTYDDISDLAVEGGITATRTTTEFRTVAFKDLVRWTGQNFTELRNRGQNRDAALRFLKTVAEQAGVAGKASAFQEWADATDKFFRTTVLINELKAGRTINEAVALARASLFDYGELPKSMKDALAKGFWLYSFRTLNAATFIDNVVNNPKRLVQAYKLKNAGYDYLDKENETYYPFMAKYAEDRMWLSIYENQEARKRYALMGPQFPIIDAAQDIFDAAQFFFAMGEALKQGAPDLDFNEAFDIAATGAANTLVGITNPIVERLLFTPRGLDIAFGEIVEANGYINADFISYLAATENLDSYIAIYNIQKVDPRPGKPTWRGYEYRVNPKDNKSKKAMLSLQQNSIILGKKTYQDMRADFASAINYDDIQHIDPKVEGWNPVFRLAEKFGIVRAAELPTREDIERTSLYEMRGELE